MLWFLLLIMFNSFSHVSQVFESFHLGIKGRNKQMKTVLILIFLISTTTGSEAARPCVPIYTDQDSFACLCNATYCDTIETFDEEDIRNGYFVHYESNMAVKRMHFSKGKFIQKQENGSLSHTIKDFFTTSVKVDPTIHYQDIFGFGGALTDTSILLMENVSEAVQDTLLRLCFTGEGLNYTFVRFPIGASDFSDHLYTYDDEAKDEKSSHFNLTALDYKYKIPYIKRIMNMSSSPIKLLAVPWVIPQWMMEPRFPTLNVSIRVKEECYQNYADYVLKFLNAYKEQGVTFWSVAAQNEPTNGLWGNLRPTSVGWKPNEEAKWIGENLGPTLYANGYEDIKILVLDDQRVMASFWVFENLQHSEAKKYISGISVHGYMNMISPPYELTTVHHLFPGLFIISSETSVSDPYCVHWPPVNLGKWRALEYYVIDIADVFNNWVSGWIDWNLFVDLSGGISFINNCCDAPIVINVSTNEFYKQPIWYGIAHFAHFVPPDSRRIDIKSWMTSGLKISAFLTPSNRVVLVILNKHDYPLDIVINSREQGQIILTLSQRSLHTFIYKLV